MSMSHDLFSYHISYNLGEAPAHCACVCSSLIRLSKLHPRIYLAIFHRAFCRKQPPPVKRTMASSRLQRLRNFIQTDVDALPDRPVSPQPEPKPDPKSDHASDNQSTGGVSLEDAPLIPPASKQTSTIRIDSPIKTPPPVENTERRFVWVKDADSAFNPNLDSMRLSTAPVPVPRTDAAALPVTDLLPGDLASPRHHFTPILALSKYPYKYCNKSHMQDIASAFFDQGKFWQREWDL
jgi:hypothetical protein